MGAGDRVPSNLPIDGHSFRRVEVLTGTPRRRRWRDAEKAAIVAESLASGAKTSEIALRYGLHRNQLYDWRRQFRSAGVADANDLTEPRSGPINGRHPSRAELEFRIHVPPAVSLQTFGS